MFLLDLIAVPLFFVFADMFAEAGNRPPEEEQRPFLPDDEESSGEQDHNTSSEK